MPRLQRRRNELKVEGAHMYMRRYKLVTPEGPPWLGRRGEKFLNFILQDRLNRPLNLWKQRYSLCIKFALLYYIWKKLFKNSVLEKKFAEGFIWGGLAPPPPTPSGSYGAACFNFSLSEFLNQFISIFLNIENIKIRTKLEKFKA